MYIKVNDVSKVYRHKDDELEALSHISLEIEKGEFLCLLGPSGCGKSTLLNAMAGFDTTLEGSILIDGTEVKSPSIKNVTIFQNYGLLPWRNVLKNVELGLESLKIPKAERANLAGKFITLVGLNGSEKSHPRQLSGGMQQRVAIARALAVNPNVLFMDEPFGALDAITRLKMQDDLLDITRSQKTTTIFVTHDIEEAVYLADRIAVMSANPGQIKEIVTVKLPTRRDRTSEDFVRIRDKIFDVLNMKEDKQIEYSI
ncbi:MAG: ABC transporter ATP-binding protein [Mobilitalea sp.]